MHHPVNKRQKEDKLRQISHAHSKNPVDRLKLKKIKCHINLGC